VNDNEQKSWMYALELTKVQTEIHKLKVDETLKTLFELQKKIHEHLNTSKFVYDKKFISPAVPIDQSITDGYIVCLEDGSKRKSLKQYLWRCYNMTPDDYRKKWNLPDDYPIVAPSTTRKHRKRAIDIGLGKTHK